MKPKTTHCHNCGKQKNKCVPGWCMISIDPSVHITRFSTSPTPSDVVSVPLNALARSEDGCIRDENFLTLLTVLTCEPSSMSEQSVGCSSFISMIFTFCALSSRLPLSAGLGSLPERDPIRLRHGLRGKSNDTVRRIRPSIWTW